MIVDQSNRGLYMLLKCQIAAVRRKLRDRNPDLFRALEIFAHMTCISSTSRMSGVRSRFAETRTPEPALTDSKRQKNYKGRLRNLRLQMVNQNVNEIRRSLSLGREQNG
jgi:hypothetical protein